MRPLKSRPSDPVLGNRLPHTGWLAKQLIRHLPRRDATRLLPAEKQSLSAAFQLLSAFETMRNMPRREVMNAAKPNKKAAKTTCKKSDRQLMERLGLKAR